MQISQKDERELFIIRDKDELNMTDSYVLCVCYDVIEYGAVRERERERERERARERERERARERERER